MNQRWRGVAVVVIIVALSVAGGLVAARLWPSGQSFDGGNELQPLADGLTWTYQSRGDVGLDPTVPLVIGVVDHETIGVETAWLLQTSIGESWSTRFLLVDRDGEVWALGVEGLEEGRWKRTIFAQPQLYQPAAGERRWDVDYSEGPESWNFTATWDQRANGRLEILGTSGNAWLVVGDLETEGTRTREVDTFVEGIGLTSSVTIYEGGASRFDLVTFGRESGSIEGSYRAAPTGMSLVLTVGDTVTLAVGDGAAEALNDWRRDGSAASFSAMDKAGRFEWKGRLTPAGLLGHVTRSDGSAEVTDFVRLRPEVEP